MATFSLSHTHTHTARHIRHCGQLNVFYWFQFIYPTLLRKQANEAFYMCLQRVNHIQWQNEMKLKMHFMQKGNIRNVYG